MQYVKIANEGLRRECSEMCSNAFELKQHILIGEL